MLALQVCILSRTSFNNITVQFFIRFAPPPPLLLYLQFLQELDDIGFTLAKKDVLGRRIRKACTAKLFQTEFEKKTFKSSRKANCFLKSLYMVNLFLFLFGMIYHVTLPQMKGRLQPQEISVNFGDVVWEDAVADFGYLAGIITRPLVYSTFNGAYFLHRIEAGGSPVYLERRKSDDKQFDDDSWLPAEIKYSSDLKCWTFSHPNIGQRKDKMGGWLLKSPETNEVSLYHFLKIAAHLCHLAYTSFSSTCLTLRGNGKFGLAGLRPRKCLSQI